MQSNPEIPITAEIIIGINLSGVSFKKYFIKAVKITKKENTKAEIEVIMNFAA